MGYDSDDNDDKMKGNISLITGKFQNFLGKKQGTKKSQTFICFPILTG
jgi:hypothetical protein